MTIDLNLTTGLAIGTGNARYTSLDNLLTDKTIKATAYIEKDKFVKACFSIYKETSAAIKKHLSKLNTEYEKVQDGKYLSVQKNIVFYLYSSNDTVDFGNKSEIAMKDNSIPYLIFMSRLVTKNTDVLLSHTIFINFEKNLINKGSYTSNAVVKNLFLYKQDGVVYTTDNARNNKIITEAIRSRVTAEKEDFVKIIKDLFHDHNTLCNIIKDGADNGAFIIDACGSVVSAQDEDHYGRFIECIELINLTKFSDLCGKLEEVEFGDL